MDHPQTTLIPSNAKTLIVVLGQCLLPNGQPHQWLLDRVKYAYSLLDQLKGDIRNTYIIASGSDVSNHQYSIHDVKKKHITEAEMMKRLLLRIHDENVEQNRCKYIEGEEKFSFSDCVIEERKARTTIQNFYHVFLMISRSKLKDLKDIIVVTSDFHMKRAKLCFDTMFSRGQQTLIEGLRYENVKFMSSSSIWTSQYFKQQKIDKQNMLYKNQWLIKQLNKTACILWDEIKGTNRALFYHQK